MFPLSGVTTDSAASAAGAHATGWARSTRGPAHITNGPLVMKTILISTEILIKQYN